MIKHNAENERIKRQYFIFLKEAKERARNNLSKLPKSGVQASPASASKACTPAVNLQRELFKLFHAHS